MAYEVVRREMTVPSLRHRVIFLLLCTWQAPHVPGSRFATDTRVLLDTFLYRLSIASVTVSLDPQPLSCTLVLVVFESLIWTYLLHSLWY